MKRFLRAGAVDLVALGIFIALTVLIPATVKLVQQNQENRSLARLAEEEDAYIEEQTQKQEDQQMYDNSPSERRAVTNPEDFNNTAAGQVKECPCGGQWPNCKNCEPDAPPPLPQTPQCNSNAGQTCLCADGGSGKLDCNGNCGSCQPPTAIPAAPPPPPAQSPLLPNGDLRCPGPNCDKCQKGFFWGAGCDDFCATHSGDAKCYNGQSVVPSGPDPNSFRCANGGGNCDQCGKVLTNYNNKIFWDTGCRPFCDDHPNDAACPTKGTPDPPFTTPGSFVLTPAPLPGTVMTGITNAAIDEEVRKFCAGKLGSDLSSCRIQIEGKIKNGFRYDSNTSGFRLRRDLVIESCKKNNLKGINGFSDDGSYYYSCETGNPLVLNEYQSELCKDSENSLINWDTCNNRQMLVADRCGEEQNVKAYESCKAATAKEIKNTLNKVDTKGQLIANYNDSQYVRLACDPGVQYQQFENGKAVYDCFTGMPLLSDNDIKMIPEITKKIEDGTPLRAGKEQFIANFYLNMKETKTGGGAYVYSPSKDGYTEVKFDGKVVFPKKTTTTTPAPGSATKIVTQPTNVSVTVGPGIHTITTAASMDAKKTAVNKFLEDDKKSCPNCALPPVETTFITDQLGDVRAIKDRLFAGSRPIIMIVDNSNEDNNNLLSQLDATKLKNLNESLVGYKDAVLIIGNMPNGNYKGTGSNISAADYVKTLLIVDDYCKKNTCNFSVALPSFAQDGDSSFTKIESAKSYIDEIYKDSNLKKLITGAFVMTSSSQKPDDVVKSANDWINTLKSYNVGEVILNVGGAQNDEMLKAISGVSDANNNIIKSVILQNLAGGSVPPVNKPQVAAPTSTAVPPTAVPATPTVASTPVAAAQKAVTDLASEARRWWVETLSGGKQIALVDSGGDTVIVDKPDGATSDDIRLLKKWVSGSSYHDITQDGAYVVDINNVIYKSFNEENDDYARLVPIFGADFIWSKVQGPLIKEEQDRTKATTTITPTAPATGTPVPATPTKPGVEPTNTPTQTPSQFSPPWKRTPIPSSQIIDPNVIINVGGLQIENNDGTPTITGVSSGISPVSALKDKMFSVDSPIKGALQSAFTGASVTGNKGYGFYTDKETGGNIQVEVNVNSNSKDPRYSIVITDRTGTAVYYDQGRWADINPDLRAGFIDTSIDKIKEIKQTGFDKSVLPLINDPNLLKSVGVTNTSGNSLLPVNIVEYGSLSSEDRTLWEEEFYSQSAVGRPGTVQEYYYQQTYPDAAIANTGVVVDLLKKSYDKTLSLGCVYEADKWSDDCKSAFSALVKGDVKVANNQGFYTIANLGAMAVFTGATLLQPELAGFSLLGLAVDMAAVAPFAAIGTLGQQDAKNVVKTELENTYGLGLTNDGTLNQLVNNSLVDTLTDWKKREDVRTNEQNKIFRAAEIDNVQDVVDWYGGKTNLDQYYQSYLYMQAQSWGKALDPMSAKTQDQKQKLVDEFNLTLGKRTDFITGVKVNPLTINDWDKIEGLAYLQEVTSAVRVNALSSTLGKAYDTRGEELNQEFKNQIVMGAVMTGAMRGLQAGGRFAENVTAKSVSSTIAKSTWSGISETARLQALEQAARGGKVTLLVPKDEGLMGIVKAFTKTPAAEEELVLTATRRVLFDDGTWKSIAGASTDELTALMPRVVGLATPETELIAQRAVSAAVGKGGPLEIIGGRIWAPRAQNLIEANPGIIALEAEKVAQQIAKAGGDTNIAETIYRAAVANARSSAVAPVVPPPVAPPAAATVATAPPIVRGDTVGMAHYAGFIKSEIPVIAYDEVDEIMARAARDLANGVDPVVVRKQATDALIAVRGLEENHVKIVENTINALVADMRSGVRVVGDDGAIYAAKASVPAPAVPATGTKTALPVASTYADQVPIAKLTYTEDESVYRDSLRKAMQAIEDALANGKTESEAVEAGRAIYLQRPLLPRESTLNPEFEWEGFGKNAANTYVRDYKRAVAVAGSKPVIAPQCVTGDTLLLVTDSGPASTAKRGEQAIMTQIKDIRAGMSVVTYDEKTGKFIPSTVEALWDKGVQPIYKLTTETGKSIRTTSEHPYLVLENNEK